MKQNMKQTISITRIFWGFYKSSNALFGKESAREMSKCDKSKQSLLDAW